MTAEKVNTFFSAFPAVSAVPVVCGLARKRMEAGNTTL